MIETKFYKNKQTYSVSYEIEKFYKDVAASIQLVCEEILLKILKYIKNKYNYLNKSVV